MPVRLEPFVNNHIYHVFNKTLDRRKLFKSGTYGDYFLKVLKYYRSTKARLSFSKLRSVDRKVFQDIQKEVSFQKYFRVDILAYCLMPNHFHLLLKQKVDNGIQKFISDTINSLTRYCNLRLERKGPLFLPKFKAERIHTNEQLLHVSRYIHLNPYSSGVVKTSDKLLAYPWSSFPEYIREEREVIDPLISPSELLAFYDGEREEYKDFVLSNAEYQKTLDHAKHTEKW